MKIALSLCFVTLAACEAVPELATGPVPPDLGRPDEPLAGRDQHLDLKGTLARAAELIAQRETPGALDQALGLLRAQWRIHPTEPVLNLVLAEIHARRCDELDLKKPEDRPVHAKQRAAALSHIETAHKALPEEGRVFYWRGLILLHFADGEQSYKRLKEALGDLLRAEKKVPALDFGGPARQIGRIYQETPGMPFLGSKPRALEWYKKALELSPEFIQNHLWIGETYQQSGQKEQARYHLDLAATLPLRQGHEREDGRHRAAARAWLLKL